MAAFKAHAIARDRPRARAGVLDPAASGRPPGASLERLRRRRHHAHPEQDRGRGRGAGGGAAEGGARRDAAQEPDHARQPDPASRGARTASGSCGRRPATRPASPTAAHGGVTFHDLRGTGASRMARAGRPCLWSRRYPTPLLASGLPASILTATSACDGRAFRGMVRSSSIVCSIDSDWADRTRE